MSGYKRVNFYELCRLCASNQQKEKTHIFQEEGRKIQLQNKIQSCLSLTVCENDFLPKVVCAQCLQNLEECYVFRKECVSSESMLSSYFKNFRYTDDFKKSGKVYIKDTTPKTNTTVQTTTSEPVSSTTTNNLNAAILNNMNFVQNVTEMVKNSEQIPVYAVQLPAVQQTDINKMHTKVIHQNPTQLAYSINPLNLAAFKNVTQKNESLGNISVNSNQEILNIAQFVDLESFIQNGASKLKNNFRKHNKVVDNSVKINESMHQNDNLIKIELAQAGNAFESNQFKFDKPAPAKTNKYAYSIKIDEGKNCNVVLNQGSDPSDQINLSQIYSNANLGMLPTNLCSNAISSLIPNSSSVNLVADPLQITSNVICSTASLNLVNSGSGNVSMNVASQNVDMNNRNFVSTSTKHTNFVNNGRSASTSEAGFASQKGENDFDKSPPQQNANAPKTHACDICQKSFKRREHLYQHVKLHTGFRPFTCENCNKSFMRKEHLLRHMTSHSGQKNFTCTICEKSFSRNDNLLKHKKTHEKQTSFTCEICQKQFIMKHYYMAHKMTHEEEKCGVSQAWGMLKA